MLSASLAAGGGSPVTIIGYNQFCSGGKIEREYWFSLDTMPPFKAGQLPVHVNSQIKLNLCVMHVQYMGLKIIPSDVERVSVRMTPSIELRAHQDKCRKCEMCTARKECKKCKDAYRAAHRCQDHEDCHHCSEFKWQKGYGKQLKKEECNIVEAICSFSNECTLELTLSDAHQRRFAFIIANQKYLGHLHGSCFESLGTIPETDAKEISHQLVNLGFQVHGPLLDVNKANLELEILAWTRKLPENAQVLVSFSGHGMDLHGERYFVSADYSSHTIHTLEQTAKEKCLTLEWILSRVNDVLTHEGLIMSFWDCCREDGLKNLSLNEVMRGKGTPSDPMIRNLDKLHQKLKQKTCRSASQLSVFASSSGALAHQEDNGLLAQALLAWWKGPAHAVLSIGDEKVRNFVVEHMKRSRHSKAQQEPEWIWGGGLNSNFRFRQDLSVDTIISSHAMKHQLPFDGTVQACGSSDVSLNAPQSFKSAIMVGVSHPEAQTFWAEWFPGCIELTWPELLQRAFEEEYESLMQTISWYNDGVVQLEERISAKIDGRFNLVNFNVFTKKNGVSSGALIKFRDNVKKKDRSSCRVGKSLGKTVCAHVRTTFWPEYFPIGRDPAQES